MYREGSSVINSDTYRAYAEDSMLGTSPINLVTSLYEGAIETVEHIRHCFASGNIMGRSKAVTKVVNILTELLLSLDHEKGGEISANLKRLYSYMQCRVLEAHARKNPAPLDDVERLLRKLLEAWYVVAQQNAVSMQVAVSTPEASAPTADEGSSGESERLPYGSYFADTLDNALGEGFSF